MDLTAFYNHPELRPGIVIYFIDKAGKTRTEVIFDRTGENIKVKNALKKMTVVNLNKNMKVNRQNMLALKKESHETPL